jgi:glycosyltransferase involved in cell wall biosynthesis
LKIALISTQPGWYGGERQLALLASGMRQRGHECVIAARADGALLRHLNDEGFETLAIRGRGRSPVVLWQMRSWLKRFGPDVVQFNDSRALTSCGLASFGLKIPLRVATRRVNFPIRSAVRLEYLSDVVICVSGAVRDACLRAGIPANRLQVVHDGVDPAAFHRADARSARRLLGIGEDENLLLTVAKLAESKGHRYLIDALPRVLATIPNTVLLCAGDGPLRGTLEKRVRDLGMSRHVRFLGFRLDVADLLAAADLMVMPSHTEGLCSAIIEAMFAGCPIAASRVGGISELLTTPESCHAWLFPPRDSGAIASTIIHAIRAKSECGRLSLCARAAAFERFTAQTMIAKTLSVYEHGLQSRPKSNLRFRADPGDAFTRQALKETVQDSPA